MLRNLLTFFAIVFSNFLIGQTTVTSVSSTKADGTYAQGELIPITVTFNEDVTVTGTPQLTLETGHTDAVVNYS